MSNTFLSDAEFFESYWDRVYEDEFRGRADNDLERAIVVDRAYESWVSNAYEAWLDECLEKGEDT